MIVVDTHVLLWWTTAARLLSPAAEDALANSEVVGVSAITAWEIAMLHRRKRISIDQDVLPWLRNLETTRGLLVCPITIEIGALAAKFHEVLRDPIDSLIAATALIREASLITKDDRIRQSGVVQTIW